MSLLAGLQTVKHSKVSETIQGIIEHPGKYGIKLKPDLCEYAYLPVVASGGTFELRVGANTDDSRLHDGVVMLHIGGKYNNECTNICRTLFFHPTPQYVPRTGDRCSLSCNQNPQLQQLVKVISPGLVDPIIHSCE